MTVENDKDPVTMCLKVVLDTAPNAVGVWRKFVVEHSHRNPRKYTDSPHRTMWEALNALVAAKYPGHRCVATQSDLRFADKPGDWFPDKRSASRAA